MSDPASALPSSYGWLSQTETAKPRAPGPALATERADEPGGEKEESGFLPFGEDGLTFYDLIDIVNPLHHIPIVSSIYRNLTGDIIDPAAKIAGGALYGGPFGAATSLAGVIVKEMTGKTPSDHVLAFFLGDDENTAIASAKSNPTPPPDAPSFSSYAGVLEWAQREANAGYASRPDMNGIIQNAVSEGIEVSHWAQRVAAENPYAGVLPVITDAELNVLRAEAEEAGGNLANATLPENSGEFIAEVAAGNQEVTTWAQNELKAAASEAEGQDQPSDGSQMLVASLASYGKAASLTSKPPGFALNGKY